MTNAEYKRRVLAIRRAMNTLADDMGATYSTRMGYLTKIYNAALFVDLTPADDDEITNDMAVLPF